MSSEMRLKMQRSPPDHIQDFFHPFIFFFIDKTRMFGQILEKVGGFFGLFIFVFVTVLFKSAIKFRETALKKRPFRPAYPQTPLGICSDAPVLHGTVSMLLFSPRSEILKNLRNKSLF